MQSFSNTSGSILEGELAFYKASARSLLDINAETRDEVIANSRPKDNASLAFDFNSPPSEAIAYLQSKKPQVLDELASLKHNIYNRVFTIRGIADVDLLSDIQKSLSLALANGESFEVWRGKAQSMLSSGNAILSEKRLKQIYHQNIITAYNQGRKMAQENLKGEVYYRYVAINDSRTRLSHKLLHNVVLPREHSFWKRHYPGSDFGCRCRIEAYTKKQLERFGFKVSDIGDVPHIEGAKFDIGDSNAALAYIINQKLKAHANNPNATQRLKGIVNVIRERNARFKRINELYKQSAIKQDKSADSKCVIITQATPKLQNELGTKAEHILLSGETLRTHTHHDNVDSFDYSLIGEILETDYKIKNQGELKIIYFSKLGEYYRAAFKLTRNKKKIFLVSLVKSSKEIKR